MRTPLLACLALALALASADAQPARPATAPVDPAARIVLVTGSKTDAADLRLACSRLPLGVRALAIVADAREDAPALKRIGEADVVTIGDLDQLPRAVRKVLS